MIKLDYIREMVYTSNEVPSHLLATGEYLGFRFYVLNIDGSHPTAYVRLDKNHPLYSIEYGEADKYVPGVHCGFTYGRSELDGVPEDGHSWFLGWDYGHCCDFMGCYLKEPEGYLATHSHKWTTAEIIHEVSTVCEILNIIRKTGLLTEYSTEPEGGEKNEQAGSED